MPTDDGLILDPRTTALVLIDLQKGITARSVAPHPARAVLANAARLADRFRERDALVVLVRVSFSPDGRDRLGLRVDAPMGGAGTPPPGWDEMEPEVGPREGDQVVTKRQWGAFYGTDLDLQLRRRGIRTLVLGGIATNMGVESTARTAHEHGYALVLAEDAMASFSAEAHEFAVTTIFPRIGRVRSTEQIMSVLTSP